MTKHLKNAYKVNKKASLVTTKGAFYFIQTLYFTVVELTVLELNNGHLILRHIMHSVSYASGIIS